MISAVRVVIPAHNEIERIGDCLESVLRALAAAPPAFDTGIWVVADRCCDGTQKVVETVIGGRPGCGWEDSLSYSPIGRVRDLGFRSVLGRLRHVGPDRAWLISTDADSTVPPNWIIDHLRKAADGAAAVAGSAALDSSAGLHPLAAKRYQRIVSRQRHGGQHYGAYAANLGVRADAYLAVGGFRDLASGEDADLLARLERYGYRVARPVGLSVTTSSRLDGRAQGGVSDLLRRLQDDATTSIRLTGGSGAAVFDASG